MLTGYPVRRIHILTMNLLRFNTFSPALYVNFFFLLHSPLLPVTMRGFWMEYRKVLRAGINIMSSTFVHEKRSQPWPRLIKYAVKHEIRTCP